MFSHSPDHMKCPLEEHQQDQQDPICCRPGGAGVWVATGLLGMQPIKICGATGLLGVKPTGVQVATGLLGMQPIKIWVTTGLLGMHPIKL